MLENNLGHFFYLLLEIETRNILVYFARIVSNFLNLTFIMDPKTQYLIAFILGGLIILTGLGFIIAGIVKKRQKLIFLGLLIAIVPTIFSLLW